MEMSNSKYAVGDRVVVDTKGSPLYIGAVTKVFPLNTNKFDTEMELKVSVLDEGQSSYGYQVEWEHNNLSNPWAEIELEPYIITDTEALKKAFMECVV